MLKEKGLDPTILALLQRNSLDVGREHADINGEKTIWGELVIDFSFRGTYFLVKGIVNTLVE
jgi:hypothetical protein